MSFPQNLTLVCLHGFLGRPEDWDRFAGAWTFGKRAIPVTLECPNLFDSKFTGVDLETWARHWAPETRGPKILVGYSLGARAAMHACLFSQIQYRGAVFISGSSGIPEAQRPARLEQDRRWREMFLSAPWEEVLARWNAQDVLRTSGTLDPARPESAFSRVRLAEALENWSVGQQCDLRGRLAELDLAQLWVAGARDEKYVGLTCEVGRRVEVIAGAGHRTPWDNPDAFVRAVQGFIDDIYEREEI